MEEQTVVKDEEVSHKTPRFNHTSWLLLTDYISRQQRTKRLLNQVQGVTEARVEFIETIQRTYPDVFDNLNPKTLATKLKFLEGLVHETGNIIKDFEEPKDYPVGDLSIQIVLGKGAFNIPSADQATLDKENKTRKWKDHIKYNLIIIAADELRTSDMDAAGGPDFTKKHYLDEKEKFTNNKAKKKIRGDRVALAAAMKRSSYFTDDEKDTKCEDVKDSSPDTEDDARGTMSLPEPEMGHNYAKMTKAAGLATAGGKSKRNKFGAKKDTSSKKKGTANKDKRGKTYDLFGNPDNATSSDSPPTSIGQPLSGSVEAALLESFKSDKGTAENRKKEEEERMKVAVLHRQRDEAAAYPTRLKAIKDSINELNEFKAMGAIDEVLFNDEKSRLIRELQALIAEQKSAK